MELPKLALYVLPVFLLLIAIEVAWFRRGGRAYPWRQAAASLGVAVGQVASQAATKAAVLGLYLALWEWTPLRVPLDQAWAWVALFLALEFIYYWFHRLSHEVRWLWATHSVHHSAETIHLAAAYRLGWTGLVSGAWLFWLPLVALGFHPGAVFLMLGSNLTYQFWLHTEAIGRLPRWLEYVFNTPSHHRVHHAVNPRYLDRNYGGVLILFDRAFGTFAVERADEVLRYGLVEPNPSANPFVIALREWGRLGRDVAGASGWRARLGHSFGPPGWRPGGDGPTAANLRGSAA